MEFGNCNLFPSSVELLFLQSSNSQKLHTTWSMKKTKMCHSHLPPNTDKPSSSKQENDEEETLDHDTKPYYMMQLPEHIVMEILCKIRTKTLIQCRCVCKSWRRWLSDPKFTKDLFSRTPTCVLLKCRGNNPKATGYFLVDIEKSWGRNDDVVLKLSKDPNAFNFHVSVLGICNGFLCLYDDSPNRVSYYYMFNPITGESLALPTPTEDFGFPCFYGFGISVVSNVHKVVLVTSLSEGLNYKEFKKIMVMTVGSGSWRNIGDCEYHLGLYPRSVCVSGVYLNGFLHWVGTYNKTGYGLICAFDVERERFLELSLPQHCSLNAGITRSPPRGGVDRVRYFDLGVLKGRLSLTTDNGISLTVWVMKDYGIKESWTKEIDIRFFYTGPCYHVLKYTEEGQVLVSHVSGLNLCSPGKWGLTKVEIDGIALIFEQNVYIPSFVSVKDVIRGQSSEVMYVN